MTWLIKSTLLFALWFTELQSSGVVAEPKPFYNIGFMANNISEADYFLKHGANGLAIDVQFTLNGTPTFTYHGSPCSCGRSCSGFQVFSDFLDYLRVKSKAGNPSYMPKLSIVHMNLRVSGLLPANLQAAGEKVAKVLINHFFGWGDDPGEMWIILGVPFLSQAVVFKSLRNTFMSAGLEHHLDKIGYDIYHYGRLDRLAVTLRAAGVTDHVWTGAGSRVCHRRFVPDRLLSLVTRREVYTVVGKHLVDRVYYWVADEPSIIRETLKLGVDAIMTNRPDTVKLILATDEFNKKMRLADNQDIPWGDDFPRKEELDKEEDEEEEKSSFNLLLSKEGNSVEGDK